MNSYHPQILWYYYYIHFVEEGTEMLISIYCIRVGPVSGLISLSYSLHCVERILVKDRNGPSAMWLQIFPCLCIEHYEIIEFPHKISEHEDYPIQFLHFQASIPVFLWAGPIFVEKKKN